MYASGDQSGWAGMAQAVPDIVLGSLADLSILGSGATPMISDIVINRTTTNGVKKRRIQTHPMTVK